MKTIALSGLHRIKWRIPNQVLQYISQELSQLYIFEECVHFVAW